MADMLLFVSSPVCFIDAVAVGDATVLLRQMSCCVA